MLRERRHLLILELLEQEKLVTIADLSQRMGVSYMTIWRDLEHLEGKNLLKRIRGGAVPVTQGTITGKVILPGYEIEKDSHRQIKERIGRYVAVELIKDRDNITIEAGTTASSMVPFLDKADLTVLTNGLFTSMLAAPLIRNLTLMCSGGILIENGAFIGPQAEEFFSNFRVKKAFFGAEGLTLEDGFTDSTPLYIRLKQVMRQHTEAVIMMIDSSKFGRRSLVQVMPLDNVDIIVTDAGAPQDIVNGLRDMGIEVHIAE